MTPSFTDQLTAVVLAHQPGKQLDDCLQSLTPAKHILLVWNGSPSELRKTPLAKNTTVLHESEPITDFSAIRNKALATVTTTWCLMIDSDEVVPKENWSVWEQELTTQNLDGLYLRRFDHFAGQRLKWGEVKNQWLLRLFRTNKTTFERPIHEVAVITGTTAKSKGSIEHYPHPNVKEFLSDVSRYAQQEARYRYKHQKGWNFTETITYPVGKFIYNLLWNQGWRDGFPGIMYSLMMSLHSFWVRIYLYELHHKNH